MAFSIGIVGLPNVGKSTLFQTITKKQVEKENYPFCTIEANLGKVLVKDERVDQLAFLAGLNKIYTTIDFVDIAGLVKGANKGEGLGNQFLANIREVDALLYVLRSFDKKNVINVQEIVDPLKEKETLDTELILKDLETVQKVLKKMPHLKRVKDLLNEGKLLSEQLLSDQELETIQELQLLTIKPRLYLLNAGSISEELKEIFEKNNWPYLVIDILTELEVVDLSLKERESFGLEKESELDLLIKKSYQLLDLITFFTINESEVRAWTLEKGKKVIEAAGKIHTDFEKNFIKAEVINWKELLEKGRVREKGKDYIVQEGDILKIKI